MKGLAFIQHHVQFCPYEWNKLSEESDKLVERHGRVKDGTQYEVVVNACYRVHGEAGRKAGNGHCPLRLVPTVLDPTEKTNTPPMMMLAKPPSLSVAVAINCSTFLMNSIGTPMSVPIGKCTDDHVHDRDVDARKGWRERPRDLKTHQYEGYD